MTTVLACENLGKNYALGAETVTVLNGVDFRVAAGETVAIIGSSGSGKTTLVNLLGGLDTPSSGRVEIAGEAMSALNERARGELRNRRLGFVFQFHHLLAEFTALENAAMPLLIRGLSRREALARAETLLAQVGLGHRLAHRPAQLSGGERQRVAIARALIGEPACVLLDEPTGNLDQDMARVIQNLLLDLNRERGTALIVVTHDPAFAGRLQRRYRLDHGQLVEQTV